MIIAMWGGLTSKFPLTIYKLIRTNIDVLDMPKVIGRGHEKHSIKENDFVIFYYGYKDVQKHIHKYENWNELIIELSMNYIKLMVLYKTVFKINPIVSFVYPIAKPNSNATMNGSDEERIKYTKFMNLVLKGLCENNGIMFLDFYDYVCDSDGYIKTELCDDGMHLDANNVALRKYVDEKILEL